MGTALVCTALPAAHTHACTHRHARTHTHTHTHTHMRARALFLFFFFFFFFSLFLSLPPSFWSSFPWEMATAVSEKVFEEGVHEFLVEVRGTGLLGFCQASFTEQRANIGKHWMNEDNRNRTWVLHSNGYFANGNQLSANERLARFTSGWVEKGEGKRADREGGNPLTAVRALAQAFVHTAPFPSPDSVKAGDRILIRLNLFKETAEYFRCANPLRAILRAGNAF